MATATTCVDPREAIDFGPTDAGRARTRARAEWSAAALARFAADSFRPGTRWLTVSPLDGWACLVDTSGEAEQQAEAALQIVGATAGAFSVWATRTHSGQTGAATVTMFEAFACDLARLRAQIREAVGENVAVALF